MAKSDDPTPRPRESPIERLLKRNKETISLTSVLIGLAGFLFGVVTWGVTIWRENVKAEESRNETAAAEAKAQAANERAEALQAERDRLSASMTGIAALDIVTRYAQQLPGTAIKLDGVRIASTTAVEFAPNYATNLKNFELDFTAINALEALARTLVSAQPDETTARDQFIANYVAPILLARCQAEDPTDAAGALAVCAYLLNSDGLLQRTQERVAKDAFRSAVEGAFRGRRFMMVDFQSKAPDFSGLYLDGSEFVKTRFAIGTGFRGTRADTSTFDDAEFDGVDLTGFLARQSGGRSARFANATFRNCRQFEGADFNGAWFAGARMYNCRVKDASLAGCNCAALTNVEDEAATELVFSTVNLTGTSFATSTLRQAKFRGCVLDRTMVETADWSDVEVSGGSARHARFGISSVGTTRFDGVDLTAADFGACDIEENTFRNCEIDWARISAGATAFLARINIQTPEHVRLRDTSNLAVLVKPFQHPADAPVPNPPRYVYDGHISLSDSNKIEVSASVPSIFLGRLIDLEDLELQELGLNPQKVPKVANDGSPSSRGARRLEDMRAELEASPAWSLRVPPE
jgi:uncharacterized protein YjbI with pentapeptide repeats